MSPHWTLDGEALGGLGRAALGLRVLRSETAQSSGALATPSQAAVRSTWDHMAFYDLGLTFEVLPGRQMVPYVTGGVGSAIAEGRSEASFNYGAGTMLFLSKRTAMRWEVRAYNFHSGSEEARVSNNNIAFTLGTSLLF